MRVVCLLAILAVPTAADAASVADLARTVLGNSAVLKRGSDDCGGKVSLGSAELIALSVARDAAEQSLSLDQFSSLAANADANAARAAAKPTFCNQTAKRKNVLLDAVKRAGQQIFTARVLKL